METYRCVWLGALPDFGPSHHFEACTSFYYHVNKFLFEIPSHANLIYCKVLYKTQIGVTHVPSISTLQTNLTAWPLFFLPEGLRPAQGTFQVALLVLSWHLLPSVSSCLLSRSRSRRSGKSISGSPDVAAVIASGRMIARTIKGDFIFKRAWGSRVRVSRVRHVTMKIGCGNFAPAGCCYKSALCRAKFQKIHAEIYTSHHLP